ncbi:MAG: glycosyltransferase [Chloroflexi bacterium]|nr:glycosyltransferase [Chloroflexota bacterium]
MVELANGLDPQHWKVTVLVFRGGGDFEADLRRRGTEVVAVGKGSRADLLGFVARLAWQLRRLRPDVVHGYLGPGNVMAAASRVVAPRHATVWGVRGSAMDMTRYDRPARLLAGIEHRLVRYTDLIICNSWAGREAHLDIGYPPRRTVVVSNGIDVAAFAPDVVARSEIRHEWQISDRELVVGIVGRLDPKKDHITFLRASGQLTDVPGLRFVSVGNDPRGRRAKLAAEAKSLGVGDRVTWHDARKDVAKVYNALDLLVSASAWGEGFPNVVGEAMACGVPCVVTNVGDSALAVGDTGWVSPPSDVMALASAIRTAIADREALLSRGARARQRIVDEFSIPRMVEETSRLMGDLVGMNFGEATVD